MIAARDSVNETTARQDSSRHLPKLLPSFDHASITTNVSVQWLSKSQDHKLTHTNTNGNSTTLQPSVGGLLSKPPHPQ